MLQVVKSELPSANVSPLDVCLLAETLAKQKSAINATEHRAIAFRDAATNQMVKRVQAFYRRVGSQALPVTTLGYQNLAPPSTSYEHIRASDVSFDLLTYTRRREDRFTERATAVNVYQPGNPYALAAGVIVANVLLSTRRIIKEPIYISPDNPEALATAYERLAIAQVNLAELNQAAGTVAPTLQVITSEPGDPAQLLPPQA